jgi:hypothetical protein
VRIAETSGRPVGEIAAGMTEAEARLILTHGNGEPSDGARLDYWMAGLFSAYLTVHRKAGSPPVTAKSVTPDWGWAGKSTASEQASMERATASLLAHFRGAAKAQANARAKKAAKGK